MSAGEAASRLYHDLGKAIVFTRRWIADDASEQERWEAVLDDLLRTRRGPNGVFSCLDVWASFCASDGAKACLESVAGRELQNVMSELTSVLNANPEDRSLQRLLKLERLSESVHQWCKTLKSGAYANGKEK